MTKKFVFVGDPGPNAPEYLALLKNAGLSAKRVNSEVKPEEVAASDPLVVVLAEDFDNRAQFVYSLRENKELNHVPILTCISDSESTEMEKAFKDGSDDICVKSNIDQFRAFLATMTEQDSWKVLRAPAGKIVLAHQDRLWRMRIGQTLRRKGFDTYFAADISELTSAMETQKPRAVVSGVSLMNESVIPMVTDTGNLNGNMPWVLAAPACEMEDFDVKGLDPATVRLLDIDADVEAVSYILNELLAPEPSKQRRSPRILYTTPVSFKLDISDVKTFHGLSYNVNSGGMFIRTTTPLPLQSRIEVSFTPPVGRGKVCMIAQVVWRKEYGKGGASTPPGMGIQFVESWVADIKGFEAGYDALLAASEQGRKPSLLPVMSSAPNSPVPLIDS